MYKSKLRILLFVIIAIEPHRRNPLRFALESIHFTQQLPTGPLFILVDDNHVKIVAVDLLHFPSLLNNLFQVVVL